jgi:hypothetical protein
MTMDISLSLITPDRIRSALGERVERRKERAIGAPKADKNKKPHIK